MKQDLYSQHANANWHICHAGLVPLLTAVLCCLLTTAHAQTNFQRLRSFGFPGPSGGGDGTQPEAPVIEGSDGALYGATSSGGSNGGGMIFRLNKDGSDYKELYSFTQTNGAAVGALMPGRNGILFGTTRYGGVNGGATVFKLNLDGHGYGILHALNGISEGGGGGFLLEASDGILYGTTAYGGANRAGTIFRLSPEVDVGMVPQSFAVLHSFLNPSHDGGSGASGLLEGRDGALYGTTYHGGAVGWGTVFRINKDGSGFTVLRSFIGGEGEAKNPTAGLIQASDGALYGVTGEGGSNNYGTVFKINPDGGGYTLLFRFPSVGADGFDPSCLVQGRNGQLYGTTWSGGSSGNNTFGYGVVFQLKLDGSGYTALHSFAGSDGYGPVGLIEASNGALYGTTSRGGDMDFGTVFKLFASTPVVVIDRIESDGTGARLNLSGGAASQTFQIQATPNLTRPSWQAIGTNQFGIDGKFQFLDTGASNYPTRFYRSATR